LRATWEAILRISATGKASDSPALAIVKGNLSSAVILNLWEIIISTTYSSGTTLATAAKW
jgi:hypothetical protein